jgi:N-hydroxyarylamine O-acetyltransferase
MDLNIPAYFERIAYHGSSEISLDTLRALHHHHLMSVPFENLDVYYGWKIELDPEKLARKIISKKRGGFCYELNGLFYTLLNQMGFDVKMISARVYNSQGILGPEFDHLAIVVELGESYLADVGFGDSFLEPIYIQLNIEQRNTTGTYKIEQYDDVYFQLSKSTDRVEFVPKYLFSLTCRTFKDFSGMCTYHQSSPMSIFTQKRICTLATPNGRRTLTGNDYAETLNGHKNKKSLRSESEFEQLLQEKFDIALSA